MTPAEGKFSRIEENLLRAQGLAKVLRIATNSSSDDVDDAMWGGVCTIACEIETALDAAAEIFAQAHAIASKP